MTSDPKTPFFWMTSNSALIKRLGREVVDAVREAAREPLAYLRVALLPPRMQDWLPLRFAAALRDGSQAIFSHPLRFISQALSTDPITSKHRRAFLYMLAASAAVLLAVLPYLYYKGLLAPFSNLQIVNRPYRQYEEAVMLKPLRYPPGMLRAPSPERTATLEEVRERERKRREEQARRERERAEQEKAERERAERERAEREKAEQEKAEQEKQAEQATAAQEANKQVGGDGQGKFGEINEAPLKEIIGKTYQQYKAGGLDLTVMNFSIMAAFEIEPDGSLSNVKITQTSGSPIIDSQALAILHAISESHALTPLKDLTSNTIRFDLGESSARLTITGFAPSADQASKLAESLRFVISIAYLAQRSKNADAAELLSLVKIKNDNKRIAAEMSTSRARASEMMRARFGGN